MMVSNNSSICFEKNKHITTCLLMIFKLYQLASII